MRCTYKYRYKYIHSYNDIEAISKYVKYPACPASSSWIVVQDQGCVWHLASQGRVQQRRVFMTWAWISRSIVFRFSPECSYSAATSDVSLISSAQMVFPAICRNLSVVLYPTLHVARYGMLQNASDSLVYAISMPFLWRNMEKLRVWTTYFPWLQILTPSLDPGVFHGQSWNNPFFTQTRCPHWRVLTVTAKARRLVEVFSYASGIFL